MEPTPPSPVSYTLDGDVAVIRLDDGKVNALNHAAIDALTDALKQAGGEARAVALIGRAGVFSAGFDLTTMRAGPLEAWGLLQHGARLALDVYTSPVPVVVGCTGHGLAMGAILLMSADARIGADGPFKIGMNEVAIGMPMPRFAAMIARERLAPAHITTSLQLATVYDPASAREAGFLDDLAPAPAVADRAIAHAHDLARTLDPGAFRATRSVLRPDAATRFERALADDLAAASGGPS